ncbi:MAG: hypothetical protein KAH97_05530, partial [Anaerolineales bacterium]|nr:hypothetical protein [Anaerolineales bacterium]
EVPFCKRLHNHSIAISICQILSLRRVYSIKVGESLTEKEFDMWWAGKAGPPHVTTHLCEDGMPTDLECTPSNRGIRPTFGYVRSVAGNGNAAPSTTIKRSLRARCSTSKLSIVRNYVPAGSLGRLQKPRSSVRPS